MQSEWQGLVTSTKKGHIFRSYDSKFDVKKATALWTKFSTQFQKFCRCYLSLSVKYLTMVILVLILRLKYGKPQIMLFVAENTTDET